MTLPVAMKSLPWLLARRSDSAQVLCGTKTAMLASICGEAKEPKNYKV